MRLRMARTLRVRRWLVMAEGLGRPPMLLRSTWRISRPLRPSRRPSKASRACGSAVSSWNQRSFFNFAGRMCGLLIWEKMASAPAQPPMTKDSRQEKSIAFMYVSAA